MSRKEDARRVLKTLENNKTSIGKVIPEKETEAFISTCRSIISNPQLNKWKKWPNTEAIDIELERNEPFIKTWLKTIIERDADPLNQDIVNLQKQIRTLYAWPSVYHESYDKIHPPRDEDGQPMMDKQQFWSHTLKERTKNKTSHSEYSDGQIEMPGIESKEFARMYKKYVKEWKKKND